MGNDGGDIPGRKELVRDRKKVEVPTAESIAMGRSRFCNLTKEPLTEPLAICRLGYIYNYENLLSSLVRKELPEKYAYIKKLTDIKKVLLASFRSSSRGPPVTARIISLAQFPNSSIMDSTSSLPSGPAGTWSRGRH
jgi:hypothetical protein